MVGHGDFWRAFAGRVFGRAVRLPNCGWAAFEGPLGPGAVLTLGPGAAVVARYHETMRLLSSMRDDQTLALYSGHPMGLFLGCRYKGGT